MRTALAALILCGCGRIAFDPTRDGGAGGAIDPSLILWFQFASGALLVDSATGHDATCTSCPGATPGPRPGMVAGSFDGTNCLYVDLPLAIRPSTLTFALWMRAADGRPQMYFGSPFMSDTSNENAFQIFATNPNEVSVHFNTTPGGAVTAPVAEWHHIAGTYDGDILRIYLDGVRLYALGQSPPQYSGEPLMIGCDRDGAVERFHVLGQIADVRLYSRALSSAELATLAQ